MHASSDRPYPFLGFGIGLRTKYYQTILQEKPAIDWFEIMTEDYLIPGGRPNHYLYQIREHYPMVMHGVSLSIGSTDPLNENYLTQVKALAQRIEPVWISDHFCWTGVNGLNMHDLLPLPYTENMVRHVVERVKRVQDFLGRQILLENVSSYVSYRQSEMTEWEFITAIAEQADCFLLLDVNNIYVSAFNHGFDPYQYIANVPVHRVVQHHLAGHQNYGDFIIDTHDAAVISPVWDLYRAAVRRFGAVSLLLERDDKFPLLSELVEEVEQAKTIFHHIMQPEEAVV